MAKKLAVNGSLIFGVTLASSGFFITVCASVAAASPVCTPPTPPFLPESDATLKEYADLINQDFERYFSDMSVYSSCLDHTRAELLAEAQEVSRLHREFLARVEALGVARKAATAPKNPETDPSQHNGIANKPREGYQ